MRSSFRLSMLVLAATLWLAGCSSSPPLVQAAPCPALPKPPADLLKPAEVPPARQKLLQPLPSTPGPAKPTARD